MTGWLQRDALIGAARQAEARTPAGPAAPAVPAPRSGVLAHEGRPHLRAVGGTDG